MDLIEKARKHFRPVLQKGWLRNNEELAFVLRENDPNIVSGGLTTAILPLTRFILMFGDFIEADDFSIESYRQRNKEKDFHIPDAVFETWKKMDCLQE